MSRVNDMAYSRMLTPSMLVESRNLAKTAHNAPAVMPSPVRNQ